MQFYPAERIAVLIDGKSLFDTARALDIDIDYRKLLSLFREDGHLIRALYYTTVYDDEDFSALRPLVDWLAYNGFTLVSKPVKAIVDSLGRRRVFGSMDVEMAVDAMRLAPSVDHIVLLTGDGNFRRLVASLQNKGKRVTVISTLRSQPVMVADDLRRQADHFVDLADLADDIRRVAPAPRRDTARAPRKRVVRESAVHVETESDRRRFEE